MAILVRPPFIDRRDAGRKVAEALMHLKQAQPIVLALPRGGVPVGHEVAYALDAPLDLLLVRKIGAPGHPELGLGAVVDGLPHLRVLNQHVLRQVNPPQGYIEAEEERQICEIRRRRERYCKNIAPVALEGRTVIVVDDGIATGGTMKIALLALSKAGVKRLIFAIPVAPREVLERLAEDADESVCLFAPENFRSVSVHYANFEQTSDEEVVELLQAAAQRSARDRSPPGRLDGHE